MGVVEELIAAGKKVVDLSADFRLRDKDCYERWYSPHSCPHLLEEAVYGLPELYREQIRNGRLIANPGCYPTGAILGLVPLLEERLCATTGIVIDSKSGVSGAGRSPSLATLFCEVAEGLKAYSVGVHRHTPEIEQELSAAAGREVGVLFVPHLIPVNRGILSTMYVSLNRSVSTAEVAEIYRRRYEHEPFVRVWPAGTFPSTDAVRGSNYCDVGVLVRKKSRQAIVITAIDNLVKGASGQAIQNMNIMCGFPENLGVEQVPLSI
jgi:N-acetyl-gamma-glutamyl-phosphate reductase